MESSHGTVPRADKVASKPPPVAFHRDSRRRRHDSRSGVWITSRRQKIFTAHELDATPVTHRRLPLLLCGLHGLPRRRSPLAKIRARRSPDKAVAVKVLVTGELEVTPLGHGTSPLAHRPR